MKIYLSEYIDPRAVELLRSRAELADNWEHPEELDAIILRNVGVTRETMEKAKKLKLLLFQERCHPN